MQQSIIQLTTSKYPGANCDQCPLKDQPFVAPYNIAHGEILFIGEAPGNLEAIEGVPFIGPSGQLLDKVIERVGRDPLRVAKTNACLCKPPRQPDGSVTPPQAALEACSGALETVLAEYPGNVVVSLGAVPTAVLDEYADEDHNDGIMVRRGVWSKGAIDTGNDNIGNGLGVKLIHYLPTLHPAFVLRNPHYVQKLIDDIQKAYDGPEKQHDLLNVGYVVIDDFEALKEMIQVLRKADYVTFDVETSYLQWYETSAKAAANVLCLVFCYDDAFSYIVPDTTLAQPRVLEFLQMFFDEKQVIAHNGKFDATVMLHRLGINVTLCDDTMLMHYVLNEGKRGHGLKELSAEYFQAPDYETLLLEPIFKQHKMSKTNRNYEILPRDILYQYAAIDGVATLKLFFALRDQLIKEDQWDWPYRNVLIRASNALAKVEVNGIPIDRAYLQRVLRIVETDVKKLEYQVRSVIEPLIDPGKHIRLTQLINKSAKKHFNVNAYEQMSIALYDVLGLRLKKQPMKVTTTNTGEECLLILLETYPENEFLRTLMEYRRVEKIRNTYVSKLLELADVNDLVHINFNLHGTETGRLSADDSLHGIPRPDPEKVPELQRYGSMIRGSFVAPKGYKLIIADYSQAELRVFADETNDPFFVNALNQGLDIHTETVKIMCTTMGIKFDDLDQSSATFKDLRTLAKNVNFGGLLYGGGASMISAQTGLPRNTVQDVMNTYFDKIQIARNWQRDQFRFVKREGYVKTRFNRKRRFILQTTQNIDEVKKASVNVVIQGGAGDLNNLSLCVMVEKGIRVCHAVHDSIIVLAPENEVNNIAVQMQTIMLETATKWYPRIPWKVDIEIVDYWYPKRPKLDEV